MSGTDNGYLYRIEETRATQSGVYLIEEMIFGFLLEWRREDEKIY